MNDIMSHCEDESDSVLFPGDLGIQHLDLSNSNIQDHHLDKILKLNDLKSLKLAGNFLSKHSFYRIIFGLKLDRLEFPIHEP